MSVPTIERSPVNTARIRGHKNKPANSARQKTAIPVAPVSFPIVGIGALRVNGDTRTVLYRVAQEASPILPATRKPTRRK